MPKFAVFSLFVFSSILVAGVYGIVHDQLTYTLAPEYFTKFKYRQFGFEPAWFGGHRPTVAVIGFLATWWTGLIIGCVLGATAFVFPDHRSMAAALRGAIVRVLLITAGFAVIGGLLGHFYLVHTGVNWWLPPDLTDRSAFITVGSVHNFSYLGGAAGMLVALVYLLRQKRTESRLRAKPGAA